MKTFIDALTQVVMAKRKALSLSLGNTCMVAKQVHRDTKSVTVAALLRGHAGSV